MSIVNGQRVQAETDNAAFLSKQNGGTTTGIIDLNHASSGSRVTNAQQQINTNKTNIATNTSNIATNAANILQNEIDIAAIDSDLTIHKNLNTNTHGITDGQFLSTTQQQLIQNKDIDGGFAANTRRITLPQAPKATLDGLTRKAATLLYANDDKRVYFDDGTDLRPVGIGGIIICSLYNPVSTTLPTGVSAIVDGVSVVNGDLVLFSNLSSGNNRVYEVSGVGSSLVWTAKTVFQNGLAVSNGEVVIFTKGLAFQTQIAKFNVTWKINDVIRLFNGTDYQQIESIKSTTLVGGTSGQVFSVSTSGSENMIIDYSIVRGLTKQTGRIILIYSNGQVRLNEYSVNDGSLGVTFSASVGAPNHSLNYFLSSGGNAEMKFLITRWSDGSGGASGVPSYTGSPSGGAAGGNNANIQFNNAGILAGSDNFNWDNSNNEINLNGFKHSILMSISLNDNQASPIAIFNYAATSNKYVIIEYGIERNNDNRVGRILISNNGTTASITDDFTETQDNAPIGVLFSVSLTGGNVNLLYASTNTGHNATFKYIIKKFN